MPRHSSTPTVVTIHDLTFLTNPEWHERSKVPFFRRAIAYAATHADVLVTISEFTARQLDEQVPEHAPVVVATLGVDLERFSADSSGDAELLRAHGLAAERPYVFFLGPSNLVRASTSYSTPSKRSRAVTTTWSCGWPDSPAGA